MLNVLYNNLVATNHLNHALGIGSLVMSTAYSHAGVEQARQYHSASVDLSRRQHLMETFSELEQHFIQLDADLINATKESERDVYDQRNQQLQTLVLSCTVMFTALSTIIVQGNLPTNCNRALIILFSVFNGFSFAFLLCCLVLCIEILALSSRFMISKAHFQSNKLDEARKNTKLYFQKLRAKDLDINGPLSADKGFQNIASVDRSKLNELWKKLEEGSTNMLNQRRSLLGKMVETETFDNFWRNHCKSQRNRAVTLFYLGTGLMLLSVMTYITAQFVYMYHCPIGAALGSGLIFLSLAYGCLLKVKISNLRPEVFFHVTGKSVEAYQGKRWKLFFAQEHRNWVRGTIVSIEHESREKVFVVKLENGEKVTVSDWAIRDVRDEPSKDLSPRADQA